MGSTTLHSATYPEMLLGYKARLGCRGDRAAHSMAAINNPFIYHCTFNWKDYIQTSLHNSQRQSCRQGSVTPAMPCVLALGAWDLAVPAWADM